MGGLVISPCCLLMIPSVSTRLMRIIILGVDVFEANSGIRIYPIKSEIIPLRQCECCGLFGIKVGL